MAFHGPVAAALEEAQFAGDAIVVAHGMRSRNFACPRCECSEDVGQT
jgi:hypothetical protein